MSRFTFDNESLEDNLLSDARTKVTTYINIDLLKNVPNGDRLTTYAELEEQ